MTTIYEVPGSATVNSAVVNGEAVNQGFWRQRYTLSIGALALSLGTPAVGVGFLVRSTALRYQVATSADDALYVIVKRTVNGMTVRNVERLHSRYLGVDL